MANIRKIAEDLVNLTVKEANELATLLEVEYGIRPAQTAVAVAGAAEAGGNGEAAVEEKTEFNVVLTGFSGNKIAVIKEVRSITGLGLKEAKELVDSAPSPIREAIPKDEAQEIKTRLEGVGAEIDLQ